MGKDIESSSDSDVNIEEYTKYLKKKKALKKELKKMKSVEEKKLQRSISESHREKRRTRSPSTSSETSVKATSLSGKRGKRKRHISTESENDDRGKENHQENVEEVHYSDADEDKSIFQTAMKILPTYLDSHHRAEVRNLLMKKREEPTVVFFHMKDLLLANESKLPSFAKNIINQTVEALKRGPPEKKEEDDKLKKQSSFNGKILEEDQLKREIVMREEEIGTDLNLLIKLGRNWQIKSGTISLQGSRNSKDELETLAVISLVRLPRDPTKSRNYSFNVPIRQVRLVEKLFSSAMRDFSHGDELNMETLDQLERSVADFDHYYDFTKMNMRGFKHKTYVAKPYEATIGWYQYSKQGKKKSLLADKDDDNTYEAMVLKKISKVTEKDGKVNYKEFVMNIPTSMIPLIALSFKKINYIINGEEENDE
jgi:hypothetical protein